MAPSCSDLLDLHDPLGQGLASISFLQFIILGVLTSLGIYRVRQAKTAWKNSSDQFNNGSNPPTSLLLPIYINAMTVMCVFLLMSCILHMFMRISFTDVNSIGYCIGFAIVLGLKQVCYEVCTFSLMSAGAGQRTYIRSFVVAFVWGAVTAVLKGFSQFYISRDHELSITLEYVWGGILFVFYLLLWLLPNASIFPHRPASLNCGRFWTLVYTIFLVSTGLRHQLYDAGYCVYLTHYWIVVLFAPVIIYTVSCNDSFYWQGATDMKIASNSIASVLSGSLNPALAMDLVTAETFGVHLINFSALTIDEAKRSRATETTGIIRNHSNADRDSRNANHFIIDSGSMAKVYRGKYRQDSVAIKLIYAPELTTELVRNLFQEASIMASLQHTHVTGVHGVCVMPPAVALCMELCIGSLHDMLHKPCVYDALFMYQQRLNRIRRLRYGEPVTPFYSLSVQPRYDHDPEYIELLSKDPSTFDLEVKSYLDNIAPDHLDELNKGVPPTFNSFTPPPILPPLPLDVQLRLAIDCITGLAFLHTQEKPVVHLDIKSGNFLVGREGLVKLADLELATMLPSADSIIAPFVQESKYHTCDETCLDLINIADCGINDGQYDELSVLLEQLDEADEEEEQQTPQQQHQQLQEQPQFPSPSDEGDAPQSSQLGPSHGQLQPDESPHNSIHNLPTEKSPQTPKQPADESPSSHLDSGKSTQSSPSSSHSSQAPADDNVESASSLGPQLSPTVFLTIHIDDDNDTGAANADRNGAAGETLGSQPMRQTTSSRETTPHDASTQQQQQMAMVATSPTPTPQIPSSTSQPNRLATSPSRQITQYPTSMGYPYELPIKMLKPVLCPSRFFFTYKQSTPENTFTYDTYPLYRVSDPIAHNPFTGRGGGGKQTPRAQPQFRPKKPLGFNQPSRLRRKIARKRIQQQQQQQQSSSQFSRYPSSHALPGMYSMVGEPSTPRSLGDREYTFDGVRSIRGASQTRRRDNSMDRYGRDSGGLEILMTSPADHYDDGLPHVQSYNRTSSTHHRIRDSSVDRSISRYRSVSRERDTRKYKYISEDRPESNPSGDKAVQIHTQSGSASVVTVVSPSDNGSAGGGSAVSSTPSPVPSGDGSEPPALLQQPQIQLQPSEKKKVTLHRSSVAETSPGPAPVSPTDQGGGGVVDGTTTTNSNTTITTATSSSAPVHPITNDRQHRPTIIVHKGKRNAADDIATTTTAASAQAVTSSDTTSSGSDELQQSTETPSKPHPSLQVEIHPESSEGRGDAQLQPQATPSSHSTITPRSASGTPMSQKRGSKPSTATTPSRSGQRYRMGAGGGHHLYSRDDSNIHADHILLDDELDPDDHQFDSFEDDMVSHSFTEHDPPHASGEGQQPPLPAPSAPPLLTFIDDPLCDDENDYHDNPQCPFYCSCSHVASQHSPFTDDIHDNDDTNNNESTIQLECIEESMDVDLLRLPSSLSMSTLHTQQLIITEKPSYNPPVLPQTQQQQRGPLASPPPPSGPYPAMFGSIPASHYTSASAHALFNLHTNALNITKYTSEDEVDQVLQNEDLDMADQHLGWGLKLSHGMAAHAILYMLDRSHQEIRKEQEEYEKRQATEKLRQNERERTRSVLGSLTTPRSLGGKGIFNIFQDASSTGSAATPRPGSPLANASSLDETGGDQPPMLDLLSLHEDTQHHDGSTSHPQKTSSNPQLHRRGSGDDRLSIPRLQQQFTADGTGNATHPDGSYHRDNQSVNTSSHCSSTEVDQQQHQQQQRPQLHNASTEADTAPQKCLCFRRSRRTPVEPQPTLTTAHRENASNYHQRNSTQLDSTYDRSSYEDPARLTAMTATSIASSPGLAPSPPPTITSMRNDPAAMPKSASALPKTRHGQSSAAGAVEMTEFKPANSPSLESGMHNGSYHQSQLHQGSVSPSHFPQATRTLRGQHQTAGDDSRDQSTGGGFCCCLSSSHPNDVTHAHKDPSSGNTNTSNNSTDYVVQVHPPGYELFTTTNDTRQRRSRNPCEWLSSRFGTAKYDTDEEIVVPQCLYWLAPEIIRKEPFGLAADTYSVACVLWEIVCRKVPYREMEEILEDEHRMEVERRKQLAKKRRELLSQGLECDIPDVHAIPLKPPEEVLGEMIGYHHFRPSIPSHAHVGLADIIRQCWHHDPSMRPSLVTVLLQLRVLYHELGFTLGKDDWYGIEQTRIECENQGIDLSTISVILE